MATEQQVEAAAAAIANARGARRGAPAVSNILEVLQGLVGGKLYREVIEDARAALEAIEAAGYVIVPAEPTFEMCAAYMAGERWAPRFKAQWLAYLKEHLGTPNECGFVAGMRAAIAVGAGRAPPAPTAKRAKRARGTT